MSNEYSIGIVTHEKRLEYVSNLVKDYRSQTPSIIHIAVNSAYKTSFPDEYRNGLLNLCLTYKDVYCSFYHKFRGIAHIWNDLIANAPYDDIILNNDDIKLLPGFIEEFVNCYFNRSTRTILKANRSFGTFFVNRPTIDRCGWFHEKYLGLGYEDHEFIERMKYHFDAYDTDKHIDLTDPKHGNPPKDCVENEGANALAHKYHKFNADLLEKGEVGWGENFRPYEKFFMDNYDKFW